MVILLHDANLILRSLNDVQMLKKFPLNSELETMRRLENRIPTICTYIRFRSQQV